MGDAPRFRLRTGAPSWDRICSVDIDRVMDGLGAGSTLSGIVDDVTFANISRRELKSAGYDAAENLVKLLQLCVEYMLHVQESLINDASKAELGRRKALDEVSDVEAKLSLEKARRRAAARQCVDFREVALALAGAARAAGVDTARWIDSLRDGEAANDDEALLEAYTDTSVNCAQCGKGFVSKEYLAQHVKSVHGDVERKPTGLPTTIMRNVGKHSPRPKPKKKGFFSSMMSWGKKKPAQHVERVWDLAAGPSHSHVEGAQEEAILQAVQDANLDADEVAFACEKRGGKLVLVATAPDTFDAWEWLAEELHACFAGTALVKDLHLRGSAKVAASREEMYWDLSGGDAAVVQRVVDEAKIDADEVSLTASGSVLTGVAPSGFDAWSWLDEELHEALAGVVKSLTLRDAKPQPAGARSLDDAIRALEGVVAVRPSVRPALELLKKERRGLK